MLNRRKFIAGSAGAIAAAGAATSPLATAHHLMGDCHRQSRLNHITKATFEALQGEVFQLRDELGQSAEVKLVEVVDEGSSDRLEQFSVQFHSVHNTSLSEATYTLEHCTAGQCQLYLQPLADTTQNERLSLRAMFSLLS